MTERERLIKVLNKERPDRVPWYADLGHWYRSEAGSRWDLFGISNCTKEIIELHREVKAGWYTEVGSLHEEYYEEGITRERKIDGENAIERYLTKLGEIKMVRRWNPVSFSWDIIKLMVETPKDLKILTYAAQNRRYRPKYENWEKIEDVGKDAGLGFPCFGYTGLGSLISYYMGIQNTIYAIFDEPGLLDRYIDIYNSRHIDLIQIYGDSPAPHFLFSDNLSGDIQSPDIFKKYSYMHYRKIAGMLHKAGKTVSAHIDGRLSGIIGLVAKTGIDAADACTPQPVGDLKPYEIRDQAGNDMILFGGISPDMWLPQTSEKDFISHVREWLDLKKINSNLVLTAGDQVPPGTKLKRIKQVYDIVENYGRY